MLQELIFSFSLLAAQTPRLETLYHIENDVLTTAQGEKFSAIAFGSPLHEDLCFFLKDPKQAQIIHNAYQKHIRLILPEKFTPAFSNALLKVCYFFGSRNISPEKSLQIALQEEGISAWAKEHQDTLSLFIQDANQSAHRPKAAKQNGPFTIVILNTSASGGNESVTHGIQSFLDQFPQYNLVILDMESLAKEADPISIATNYQTYDGLYTSVYQQGNNPDILIERDVLSRQIGKYVPSCLVSRLKEKILDINPDLILSTRSYTTDDLALVTLDIPFRMIHCDYELSFFLLNLYGKANPDALRFWLTSQEPSVFKPLFLKADRLDLYKESDSQEALMEKVSVLTNCDLDTLKRQFEVFGFPTRPEFHRIHDPKKLAVLQKQWDIQSHETPILVCMGKNGVGVLEKLFDQFLLLPPNEFKFLFVCGKNEELKMKLQQKLAAASELTNSFAIYGFATPQEMNDLMNVSSIAITKPGGASVAEAIATGTYFLMMEPHPWEQANGNKLETLQLGQYYKANLALEPQLKECIAKAKLSSTRELDEPDWKAILLKELESIATTSES